MIVMVKGLHLRSRLEVIRNETGLSGRAKCHLPYNCCDRIAGVTMIKGFLRLFVANTWGIVRPSLRDNLHIRSSV